MMNRTALTTSVNSVLLNFTESGNHGIRPSPLLLVPPYLYQLIHRSLNKPTDAAIQQVLSASYEAPSESTKEQKCGAN